MIPFSALSDGAEVEYRVLGPLELVGNGTRLNLGCPRQRETHSLCFNDHSVLFSEDSSRLSLLRSHGQAGGVTGQRKSGVACWVTR